MRRSETVAFSFLLTIWTCSTALGQPYGEPVRGQPGDQMIQSYLAEESERIHDHFLAEVETLADWKERREQYRREYFHMLGLDPLPEKTPLKVTKTGELKGDGYVVEMLHYQSRPRLYVTANLYRPAVAKADEKFPAILYVCGHSHRGRNGNKTAYQSHGIWFARHGYVCLMLDTLQLGEIAATHHGTYRYERWWWHSRGYTPAGVECWNGVRGIDYLQSRDDVDSKRIAVTGISGGGAATFWVAAADERVRVAVPVSGMADLPSYVSNRVINGHCDCMFLYNTFQWPWTRIAGLIAPRPQLFVNSDADRIFPMDANRRVISRLEDLYSLYGAGDQVDAVVSVGGHAYREDIRRAAFRFINIHLKQDAGPVADSEVDLVTGPRNDREHPIPPEKLRVFALDEDIPPDELNTTIDEHFVPLAKVDLPKSGEFAKWKRETIEELRRITFRSLPERIKPAEVTLAQKPQRQLATEPGIRVPITQLQTGRSESKTKRVLLWVHDGEAPSELPSWLDAHIQAGDALYLLQPRGVGPTRWTTKNPPNYVERSHLLLGTTVDTGRVRDVTATARLLHAEQSEDAPVHVIGKGNATLWAAYAAVLEPEIAGAILIDPPRSHMNSDAPQFLNILRVCDVPEVLGLLAPKPLTITGDSKQWQIVSEIYQSADAADRLQRK